MTRRSLPKLRLTPQIARIYLLAAVFLIALPSMLSLYNGHEGKFLVATGIVAGSPFEKTVIYLNSHKLWGASGIIINKPLAPDDPRPDVPVEKEEMVSLMYGGPVETEERFFYLNDEMDILAEYDPFDPRYKAMPKRLYAGYAGWGPMQLNREIARYGAWSVIDYDPGLMFNLPREKVWDKAMEEVLKKYPVAVPGI